MTGPPGTAALVVKVMPEVRTPWQAVIEQRGVRSDGARTECQPSRGTAALRPG